MIDPVFWLGLSILLVAVSLTAVLIAALPALQELGRAARSAEKLFDTLRRELPPTLEAIRLTGLEISDLTNDVSQGVQSASQVAKQVDTSVSGARDQVKNVEVNTRSVVAGVKAAWKTWNRPPAGRRSVDRLSSSQRAALEALDLRDRQAADISPSASSANGYREYEPDEDESDFQTREAAGRDANRDSLSPTQYEDLDPPE